MKVSSEELLKAACCNLSESFETNPTIDVNFSDALTGTKQIKMLGLESPYMMISEENIPMIRGASQAYGLTFIPGTWIESIQITKGAGSIVNGFESISGQINTELKKPFTDLPLFINLFGSQMGRLEANVHINRKLSNRLSTGAYIHLNSNDERIDQNPVVTFNRPSLPDTKAGSRSAHDSSVSRRSRVQRCNALSRSPAAPSLGSHRGSEAIRGTLGTCRRASLYHCFLTS